MNISLSRRCLSPQRAYRQLHSAHCSYLEKDPVVYVACKHSSDLAMRGFIAVVKWLSRNVPRVQVLAGPAVHARIKSHSVSRQVHFVSEESETALGETNLVISCGGDGSMLHVSSIFQSGRCPPVLPFSLGSLGFLSTFDYYDYKIVLNRLFRGSLSVFERMRLTVESDMLPNHRRIVLNEVLLSRGRQEHVPELEFGIDGDLAFPSVIADGLLLATGTGSTGHSLSAGGPIMHPAMDAVLVNMIAPRTLSFRPLVLPIATDSVLTLALSDTSRASSVELVLDGRPFGAVQRDRDVIKVSKAQHPLPVFNCFGTTPDWNNRLSRVLCWNQPFRNTSRM